VLHNSPVSVMVVHQPPRPDGPLRVLVAADGSAGHRASVADLVSLADPNRCMITVLSAANVPYRVAVNNPYPLIVGIDPGVVEEFIEKARRHAESSAGALRQAGFRCEVVATDGSPHHLILEEATEGGYDLVVVGSHGRGAALRTLLGSVSDAVARNAPATLVGRKNLQG